MPETSVPKPSLSPTQQKRLDAATAIRSYGPDRIDFLHTVQCQCGIPYGNPCDEVREWERKQGLATLRIEAGSAYDPATGGFVKQGLPYGEKPRLVLIHLATEAIRSGSSSPGIPGTAPTRWPGSVPATAGG